MERKNVQTGMRQAPAKYNAIEGSRIRLSLVDDLGK